MKGKGEQQQTKEGEEKKEGQSVIVHADGKPFEEWVGPQSVVGTCRSTLKSVLLPCAINDDQFRDGPYIVKVFLREAEREINKVTLESSQVSTMHADHSKKRSQGNALPGEQFA